ncbi:MAG: hypothetical protein ACO36A_01920 [Ilumatobacteraceae bacterium]
MGRGSRLVAVAFLALAGVATTGRTGPADAVPVDDWTSDLTECVWTNGRSTSCSLNMSSPVATMTISGTNTNTTYEDLGDKSILARRFDSNRPSINFVTDAVGGDIGSISFKHFHNHSTDNAPNSYTVMMEILDSATNTWSAFGDPYTVANIGVYPIYPGPQTVNLPTPIVLLPNTDYSLRWQVTDNGPGFTNFTNGSFYGISNLVMGFRKNQSITVTQAADTAAGGTVSLSANISSGLPVTWASTTPGVCTVAGSTASLLAPGTCTVTADQTGDAVWVAAPQQTMSFNVLPAATTTTNPTTSSTSTTSVPAVTTTDAVLTAAATTTTAPGPAGPTTAPGPAGPTTVPGRAASAVNQPTPPRVAFPATTTTAVAVVPVTTTSTTTLPLPAVAPAPVPSPVVDPSSSPFRTARSADRFFSVALATAPSGTAVLSGTSAGLAPGSVVSVVLQPGSVSVGTVTVAADGTAILDLPLPASFDAMTSRVELRATSADGEEVGAVGMVPASGDDTDLSAASFGEFIGVLPAAQIERAAESGLPVYDTLRNVGDTVALTTSAAVVGALALGSIASGAGGRNRDSRRPRGGGDDRSSDAMRVRAGRRRNEDDEEESNSDESAEAELGATDANLLDSTGSAHEGRGDRSRSWRLPGAELLQRFVGSLARWAEHRSMLVTRVATDGQWARASLGSAASALWLAGGTIGALAALAPSGGVVRLSVGFACVIVALAMLDAAAGAFAFGTFVMANLLAGNVGGLFDTRTLLGVALLFVALPSIGSAIRPFRRTVENRHSLMDRAADYLIAPLFLGYAGSAAFAALNGLSGLDMVSSGDAEVLRNVIFAMTVIRLLLEDSVPRAYPRRWAETTVEVDPAPSRVVRSASVAIVGVLYLLGAGPFYGYGWQTWVIVSLLVAVPALGQVSHLLPNLPRAHRVVPRGVLRSVLMCYFGAWFATAVMSAAGSAVSARSIAVVLLLPGVVLGVIDCFAREGGEWPETTLKRAGGLALWALSALILVGIVTP